MPTAKAKPPIHFDVFGSLEHVLASIDHMVPRIFKGEDISFIPTLKSTIRMHTQEHKWDVIVLSLSKGMAREELDVILNHLPEHEGPLIIDATASTPEHDVIYNEALLLARKERIIRLNDETSDVMIVLYGIEGIDPPMERTLLMRRLRYMGVTLDMMIERNEDVELGAREEGFTGHLQRAMNHLRSIYAHDTSEEAVDNYLIAGQAFMALSAVLMAYEATQDDYLKQRLDMITSELRELPTNFHALDISYVPFGQAVDVIARRPPGSESTYDVEHGVPHDAPHDVPHDVPHGVPHDVPHGVPHDVPHGVANEMRQHGSVHTIRHDVPRGGSDNRPIENASGLDAKVPAQKYSQVEAHKPDPQDIFTDNPLPKLEPH